MPNLGADSITIGSDGFTSLVTPAHRIGARGVAKDGRVFRYVRADAAAALVAGNTIQSQPIVTAHLANTPPVVALGATSFQYTPGSATGAANLYQYGYLQVDTTPGNGYMYRVDNHPAIASATAFTLTLASDDAIQVALTTGSRVGLIPNPFNGVVQMPATTATGVLVGVATYIIAAGQYGWILTYGLAPVLISGTPALGAAMVAPSGVAGAAVVMDTTVLVTAQIVGNMNQIGVSGKNNAVLVKIHP